MKLEKKHIAQKRKGRELSICDLFQQFFKAENIRDFLQ